jgi:hypothetical protein
MEARRSENAHYFLSDGGDVIGHYDVPAERWPPLFWNSRKKFSGTNERSGS